MFLIVMYIGITAFIFHFGRSLIDWWHLTQHDANCQSDLARLMLIIYQWLKLKSCAANIKVHCVSLNHLSKLNVLQCSFYRAWRFYLLILILVKREPWIFILNVTLISWYQYIFSVWWPKSQTRNRVFDLLHHTALLGGVQILLGVVWRPLLYLLYDVR